MGADLASVVAVVCRETLRIMILTVVGIWLGGAGVSYLWEAAVTAAKGGPTDEYSYTEHRAYRPAAAPRPRNYGATRSAEEQRKVEEPRANMLRQTIQEYSSDNNARHPT